MINCHMIMDFVLDCMHLINKGVLARKMDIWINGHPEVKFKLSRQQQREMLAHLHRLSLPSDFQRRLRNLHYVKLWKASEYRMFLHYAGFVVLKDRLCDAAYQHFMLLFVAITFLSTSHHEEK